MISTNPCDPDSKRSSIFCLIHRDIRKSTNVVMTYVAHRRTGIPAHAPYVHHLSGCRTHFSHRTSPLIELAYGKGISFLIRKCRGAFNSQESQSSSKQGPYRQIMKFSCCHVVRRSSYSTASALVHQSHRTYTTHLSGCRTRPYGPPHHSARTILYHNAVH